MPVCFRKRYPDWSCSTAWPIVPARRVKPADVRIAEWISDLDKLAQRKIHRYASVTDGAERILHRNRHLTREQARYLATHGLKQNPDGTYGWKFDPYLRARAPSRRFRAERIS
jgi:hypothetical protein